MAVTLGDVLVNITASSKNLDSEFNRARGKTQAFGNVLTGVFQGVGQRLFDGIVSGVRGMASAVDESINKASDLNESVNKVGVVFGQSADEILEWSRTTDTALGQSTQQALEAASSFGNLFTSLGTTRGEAANMSRGLVELASDLASFNNIDPTEALEKLRSGIVGETEPLRALGVFLNEAVVQSKAAELGFGAVGTKLTEQEKVLARYALIMDQTANAQGDFARTSNALANAQRRLTAQTENLGTTFGQAILPIKTAVVNGLSDIIETVKPYAGNIVRAIANGMAAAVRYITPALLLIRQVFVSLLRPGSPPKLLPELNEWGAAAVNEWLKGWTKGDFGILDGLSQSIEQLLRSFVSTGQLKETDLINRVLGSRNAIARAIAEFKEFGSVSQRTLSDIVRYAGPAGNGVAALVSAYFDLQRASEGVRKAQDELNRVTEQYDAIIDPLRGRLDDVRDAQRRLQDEKRKIAAINTLNSFEATQAEKEAARLELQEIALQAELDAAEKRKDAATDTAQTALDAAEEEEKAAQERLDTAQSLLQQQIETNNLMGEQIALEQRLRAEREAAAKAAQAEAEALQQALLQYQLGLTDTQGKIALLRGELAKTQVGSVEYYNLLGQIHDLEQQAADEAKRNAEQLTDAQLRYRLATADTQGQLAILREELAKTAKDSVEYFDLLTQIANLEDSLAKGGAGALGLPEIPALEESLISPEDILPPEAKQAVEDLSKAIDDLFTGLSGDIGEISPQVKNLVTSFEEVGAAVKAVLQALGILSKGNLGDAQGPAAEWNQFRLDMEQGIGVDIISPAALQRVQDFANTLTTIADSLKIIADIFKGDFGSFLKSDFFAPPQATGGGLLGMFGLEEGQEIDLNDFLKWVPFYNTVKEGLQTVADLFPSAGGEPKDTASPLTGLNQSGTAIVDNLTAGLQWIPFYNTFAAGLKLIKDLLPGSEPADTSSPLYNLTASGTAILQNILDGLIAKWGEIKQWFIDHWQEIKDLLPGSEPADASSPLSGLSDAGGAILGNIWDGLKKKWDEVYAWWNGEEGIWGQFTKVITDLGSDFYDAGEALLDNLWDGLKSKWTELSEWWSESLQWITDQMPGSEPRDPSSPLRGLGDSGEALIGNIQSGMERALNNLQGSLGGLRDAGLAGAAATNTTTTNMGGITINVNVPPGSDATAVRTAVTGGVRDALRAAGVQI